MPITIIGTLSEVKQKLQTIRAIIEYRRLMGWHLFNYDEEWRYETQHDERVCPTCLGFAGDWVGAQIPVEFNSWNRNHPFLFLAKNEVYPNTHESHPEKTRGDCRCTLSWDDYLYVLKERLFKEFEENV